MSSDRVAALRTCTMPERAEAIEQLGALLCAVQAELVDVVAASDLEADFRVDGATGTAAWLMALLHVGHHTATDWVRVGAALQDLPEIRGVFASGGLSWDQVGPATVYATPESDPALARDLPGHTAHQINALAKQHRARTRADAQKAQRVTAFHWRQDLDGDGFRYAGFLPADQGARLNACLEREAERLGPDADTGMWAPFQQRAAQALVGLADQTVADNLDPQGAQVVVHVDAEVLDGSQPGNGTIGDLAISRDSVLRLLCGSHAELSFDTSDGRTVGIGRASQAVPRWLRRRIATRDGCCRFPGCERPIRHRHHLEWWSRGGPTNADNLVGLCWWHHHCVHEGGWTITGNPEGELIFRSPYERELRSKPKPLRSDVRQRALGDADPPTAA